MKGCVLPENYVSPNKWKTRMKLFGSYRMGDRPQWGRYSFHAVSGLAYSPAHCLFDAGLKAQLLV